VEITVFWDMLLGSQGYKFNVPVLPAYTASHPRWRYSVTTISQISH